MLHSTNNFEYNGTLYMYMKYCSIVWLIGHQRKQSIKITGTSFSCFWKNLKYQYRLEFTNHLRKHFFSTLNITCVWT